MTEPKEPGYFVEGLDYYPSDEDWYLGLFEEGGEARYRGESSTHYTKLPVYPGVAERIAEYCESPRFIYLMRDPIDRAISHYWHNTRQNQEFRSPMRAIEDNIEYKAFGDYPRQLRPYQERFEENQLFVTTFERLVSAPGEVTSDIFLWLGLYPLDRSDSFPARNTAPKSIERFMLGQTLGEFLHRSALWDALSPLVPQRLKDAIKDKTTRSFVPQEHSMDEVVESLRPWAEGVATRVVELLGREPDEWTTTLEGR